MRLEDRSDTELVELARAGWAPAFAVLFHRHAALVHGAAQDRAAPVEAVEHVFVRAMRDLRSEGPGGDVGEWLAGLAGASAPSAVELPPAERDAVWRRLHERWPDGRRHRHRVPWRGVGLVAALVVLAAAVPAVLLLGLTGGLAGDDESRVPEEAELRATPVPEDGEPAEPEVEADLPDFSFPSAGSPTDEATEPEVSVEEPSPEPEPQPETETEPEPSPPDPEPSDPDEDESPAEPDESDEREGEDPGLLDPLVSDDESDGSGDDRATGPDEGGEQSDQDGGGTASDEQVAS